MIQEEKELLLKELSERLCYGIICAIGLKPHKLKGINKHKKLWWFEFDSFRCLDGVKPYLRPMLSMTQEEIDEYDKELSKDIDIIVNGAIDKEKLIASNGNFSSMNFIPHYGNDWLNKKMFDYRGLIGKNLALEAPKDMYK